MARRDLYNDITPVELLVGAVRATGGTVASTGLDLLGYNSCMFIVVLGTPGDTLVAGTNYIEFDVQVSDTSVSAGFVAGTDGEIQYALGTATANPSSAVNSANNACGLYVASTFVYSGSYLADILGSGTYSYTPWQTGDVITTPTTYYNQAVAAPTGGAYGAFKIGYLGIHRFVRINVVVAGTQATGTYSAITAILGNPLHAPAGQTQV
jgi:hypothetical protein